MMKRSLALSSFFSLLFSASGCQFDREAILKLLREPFSGSNESSAAFSQAPPLSPASERFRPRQDPKQEKTSGERCVPGDSDSICLALKYVVYEDSSGEPIETLKEAGLNVDDVNRLWAPCNVQFQIDRYLTLNPSRFHFRFRTADYNELHDIRKRLMDEETLLVVTTGAWDRSGTLGNTWANAWTSMPGEEFYGAILEQPVSRNANILAHELGHYLSLDHQSDPDFLMNPIIHRGSVLLSREECESARWAVRKFWKKMKRR